MLGDNIMICLRFSNENIERLACCLPDCGMEGDFSITQSEDKCKQNKNKCSNLIIL